MGRNRVLSFMSQLSGTGGNKDSRTSTPSPPNGITASTPAWKQEAASQDDLPPAPVPPSPVRADHGQGTTALNNSNPANGTSAPYGRPRSTSRPMSMIQTYQPHMMDVNDTIPELQPIFTFLNSHANKLYQEGYFLKLDDQNTQGRPNPDRNWTECFAQLVGTVLSLWDAAELDTAGEEGEVLPKFINLTDASIKMIDSLPTRTPNEQPLQNILSVSTAGRNRYLLHFNSHHSLIQWTSSIRLSMFEQSTLQEAYTGCLIAGKGKSLNNINLIMDRSRFKTEDWVRVRFGAGVPWRRCWCVITPPDEKEVQKQQKEWKKRSPYDRTHMPQLKGNIKFYDTKKEGKKQKKAKPIASMENAYAAYAIYPQSKALIDASTLIKIEGTISIHTDPPSSTEGFVFIMPEVNPAVTGFEMLLRFLFPTWDTFGLYGRPGRLVASVLDSRSLMFAMPKHRRYGYMEILDVTGLVLTDGSSSWTEREWRKRMKELTGQRMAAMDESGSSGFNSLRNSRRSSKRLSTGPNSNNGLGDRPIAARPKVNFADDGESVRSSRSLAQAIKPSHRNDSAPPTSERQRLPSSMAQAIGAGHGRNMSDTRIATAASAAVRGPNGVDPTLDGGHGGFFPSSSPSPPIRAAHVTELPSTPERMSSEDEVASRYGTPPSRDLQDMQQRMQPPEPVYAPPAFNHAPSSRPAATPYHSPELRRANSRLSNTTLAHLVKAGGVPPENWPQAGIPEVRPSMEGSSRGSDSRAPPPVPDHASTGPPVWSPVPSGPGSAAPNTILSAKQAAAAPELLMKPLPQPVPTFMRPGPRSTPEYTESALPPLPQDGRSPSAYPQFGDDRQLPRRAQGPPPPPHSPLPQSQPQNQRPRTPPLQASLGAGDLTQSPNHIHSPIQRKPLPPRADSLQKRENTSEPQSAKSGSNSISGEMADYYINEAALEQVHYVGSDEADRQDPMRQNTKRSEASSRYEDASSTTSPDYASTHESIATQGSVERPRAGVLRTVGDVAPPVPPAKEVLDIPEIDFGRTINYASTAAVPRIKTPTPVIGSPGGRPYSPAMGPSNVAPARKSPREQGRSNEANHYRQDSDDTIRRRSVAWQPAAAQAGTGLNASASDVRQGAMTPEQYVLQRANQANAAMHVHQRNPSNNSLAGMRTTTPSPGLRRTSSHDLLSSAVNQQPQRPSSQGAGSALGGTVGAMARPGQPDISSHLSAREQEHLARMTGTPLINMANSKPRTPQGGGGAGLVGAIAAREREKLQMKEGYSSQAVQHAINQRQQIAQQQYMQQQQQQQAQMYGGFHMPQAYGIAQSPGQMGPQVGYGQAQQASWGQMPGGWPAMQGQQQLQQQGAQQNQFVQMGAQQGYGGYVTGQYPAGASGMGAPRSRTPGAMGQGAYHGQAF